MNRLYILFPHCYVKATPSELLIYDTTTFNSVYMKDIRLTANGMDRLNRFGYIEENSSTTLLLQKIEAENMGYYIEYDKVMPYVAERKLRITTSLQKEKRALGHNLTSYTNMMVTSVTLLLNNTMSAAANINDTSCKQLEYPDSNSTEIDMEGISAQLGSLCLEKVTLSGEMPWSQLDKFIQWADDRNIQVIYRIHYLAYPAIYIQKILQEHESLMAELIIDSGTPADYLGYVSDRLFYKYMIESAADISKAQMAGGNVVLTPIFTDTKAVTLQPQMVLTKDEVLQLRQTLKDCYMKDYVSTSCFGHLTINHNGDVYCLNMRIGSLRDNDLPHIINSWVGSADCDWYITRKDKDCCKGCALQTLCPPISLYEQLGIYQCPCHI